MKGSTVQAQQGQVQSQASKMKFPLMISSKLLLFVIAFASFFSSAAHAFSVTREEFIQFDQNSVMAYLTSLGRSEAQVEFRGMDPSMDTNFVATVSASCAWNLRVSHTPIPRGIGNGMVERKVDRISQTGRCYPEHGGDESLPQELLY